MKERQTTVMTNAPIEPRSIPAYELDYLAQSALQATRKYFEDPKVQADFRRWQAEEAAKGATVQ